MKYEFNLPCKAFSINSYYYKTRSVKTKEARAWEEQVLHLLDRHPALLALAEKWRITGGIFHIAICNNYPVSMYYNRFGQVSAKTFDITNCEKPLVDLIFGSYMKINDRFLTVCTSSKRPVEGPHSIDITLELLPSVR